MSLSALAWGPGHPSIVTFDDKELLAYDSESEGPKWRLELDKPIAGVVLADATFLDLGDASSPFRTPAAVNAVLAVDEEGRMHAVDASSGRKIGDVGPFGKPRSLAASAVGQGIAVAVPGKVCIWRKGTKSETMLDATAVAFSIDGATLAVATEQGVVKMFDLTGLDGVESLREVLSFDAKGPVNDLVQHPSGAWLVAGSRATLLVDGPNSERTLEKIPVGAKVVRFDARGTRVAAQLSQRQILVYEWPQLSVLTRIEYTERPVRGLAFGNKDWLGVAMDYGDGNKIDVVTNAVHRTDTHPGRQHRSWSLYVEGGKKPAAASGGAGFSQSDEDAIRRMREPSSGDSGGGFGRGGRIGIISILSIGLLCLKLCVRLGSSGSSYSPSYSSSSGYTPPATCDQACATERVSKVVADCARAGCSSDANEAATALAAGDCSGTQTALARIPKDSSAAPLLGIDKLLAEMGVREACSAGAVVAKAKKKITHPKLVRLAGTQLTESTESIPEPRPTDGEKPRSAWTAPDGTLFVLAVTGGSPSVVIHRRTPAGTWDTIHDESLEDSEHGLSIAGLSATDVYATFDKKLFHFDGKKLEPAKGPSDDVLATATTKQDVFVVTGASPNAILRRRGAEWEREKLPEGTSGASLHTGGAWAWTTGIDKEGVEVPVARSPEGTWSIKRVGADAGATSFEASWVTPSGDPLFFAEDVVLRGSNGGAKWTSDDFILAGTVRSVWARSTTDVFAATYTTVMHFDGKAWTRTSQTGKGIVLSGTAKEVFVVRADD